MSMVCVMGKTIGMYINGVAVPHVAKRIPICSLVEEA
jgi:hypothetical protein